MYFISSVKDQAETMFPVQLTYPDKAERGMTDAQYDELAQNRRVIQSKFTSDVGGCKKSQLQLGMLVIAGYRNWVMLRLANTSYPEGNVTGSNTVARYMTNLHRAMKGECKYPSAELALYSRQVSNDHIPKKHNLKDSPYYEELVNLTKDPLWSDSNDFYRRLALWVEECGCEFDSLRKLFLVD